ncbi:MAG: LysM peptidoglycan-binding domain-containing protein [Chloroflexota bacterium]
MRKFIWLAIIVLLLAACQNNGNGASTSNPDNGGGAVAEQPEVPRIENTPVPTATPIPTAMPLPVREHPGHIEPVTPRLIHVVESGDTLGELASKYNVTVKAIADSNRHYDFDLIKVGDAIYIPPCDLDLSTGR